MENRDGQHQQIMFYSGRTCYSMKHNDFLWRRTYKNIAEEIEKNGGRPYLLSFEKKDFPLAFFSPEDKIYIHELF